MAHDHDPQLGATWTGRCVAGTGSSMIGAERHVTRLGVDEMEAEMRQMARFKSKNSEQDKTAFLAEKFMDLRLNLPDCDDEESQAVGTDNLKQRQTFSDISVSRTGCDQPRCSASQSLCQISPDRLQNLNEGPQVESTFLHFSFLDKLGETELPGSNTFNDDAMDDVMTSWTPAVLRRISSPRISKATSVNSDDMVSGDHRSYASDSDSISRVSFRLDENQHVTNRKTQSMSNFLDLNSERGFASEGGELNMSYNNSCDVTPHCGQSENERVSPDSVCRLSYSESEPDVRGSSLTYEGDVSDNVNVTPETCQAPSPQSPDSFLDAPSEVKVLTHNSLGRHDGDVIKDYQRTKRLDAMRKRKRGTVASIRQSAISVANHVMGVFKKAKVKDEDGESRSSARHKSPKKTKTSESSPEKQLFNIRNQSFMSSSSSDYELNMH